MSASVLGRDPAEDRPRDRGVGAEAAAQEQVVGLAAHAFLVAHRRALEAEIADPVVPAGVRAAVEVQLQSGERVAEAGLEVLDEGAEPRLGLRDGEVAVRLAGARDRLGTERVACERQAELRQPLADALELAGAIEVRTRFCCRVTRTSWPSSRELRDRDHLLAREQADLHGDADRDEAVLLLRLDAHVVGQRRRRVELEVGQLVAEPPLDLGAHPFRAEVVDHELEPRLHAGDAVAEVFLPRVEQRAQDRHRLVDTDEDTEVAREPGHRREAAADEDGEARLAVPERADERDAVDLRRVAAVRARGDRDLVLARQVRVVRVPVEEARHLVDDGRHVEELVVGEAGDGAAGHVPDGVAARADCRQPHLVEPAEDLRQRGELEVVELDRLPGRELARPLPVPQRELADRLQLRGSHAARGQLDPEHERPDLRLVVVEAPPLQPDEVFLGHLLVARRDQRGELAEHPERALLALDPLDRVALQHELERRRCLLDRSACHRLVDACHDLPCSLETAKAPVSGGHVLLAGGEVCVFASSARRSGGAARAGWST